MRIDSEVQRASEYSESNNATIKHLLLKIQHFLNHQKKVYLKTDDMLFPVGGNGTGLSFILNMRKNQQRRIL